MIGTKPATWAALVAALVLRSAQIRWGGRLSAALLIAIAPWGWPTTVSAEPNCPLGAPLGSPQAGAQTSCEFLARSPVFLDPLLEQRCAMDEDGNGLDDEMEDQIAHCFVPEFRFDADETLADPPSLLPCEPIVGYSAYRIQGATADEVLIRIEYVGLQRRDGGFVSDDGLGCGDAHEGDSDGYAVEVRVTKSIDGVWRAQFQKFSRCAAEMDSTHPVMYLSAGKHHFYCYAGVDQFEVTFGLKCTDPHRGNGALRIPTGLFRVPVSLIPIVHPGSSIEWANVCHYVATGEKVPSTKLQPNNLDNLGYAGETLTGAFFYDSEATGVYTFLKPGSLLTFDADGDGLSEGSFTDINEVLAAPVDPCALDAQNPNDDDQDGLSGKCDPDLNFRQKYVGIGTSEFAPVPEGPWWLTPVPFGGFWDGDQDGTANGFDQCPTIPKPVAGIPNRWGEDTNWPPNPVTNNELGFFQRGGTCDPYPVALSKWVTPEKSGSACGPAHTEEVGDNDALVDTGVTRGVSANDTWWDNPIKTMSKPFGQQTYRCACTNTKTGAKIDGAQCVLEIDSDCFRANAHPASATEGIGRGFRPIDRPGCSRDAESWCNSTTLILSKPGGSSSKATWAWLDELLAFGTGPTPHFAVGDAEFVPTGGFILSPFRRLTHDYAVWTLVNIAAPPAIPTTRPSSLFPDPEYDPLGRAGTKAAGDKLWNVTSSESRRMRASFSEAPLHAESVHTVSVLEINCQIKGDLHVIREELWWGQDPISPEHLTLAGVRLIEHDGGRFDNIALLRPLEGNYATGELFLTEPSWLTEAPVQIAAVSGSRLVSESEHTRIAVAPSGRDPAQEPDLIAVEREGSPPRWARLAPVSATDTRVTFRIRNEGFLRGPISADAVIVSDAAGKNAAVIDFAAGMLEAIAYDTDPPARHKLPELLLGRVDAAVALHGSSLLIAGGTDASGIQQDLWLVDLHSGLSKFLRDDLPGRVRARLTITPSGDAVLLAGGIDAFGGLHDDVWRLADAENEPGAVAPMRIAADTTQASRFDTAKTAIVLDTVTETLAAAAFDPTILAAVDLRVRTDAGWEAATRALRPMQCEATDRIGGQRCALGSEWWGSIGRTGCGSSVCEGSRDVLIGQSEMAGPVLAADVDPTSVWLLRTHALERWRVEVDGSTTLAASARLPSTGRDLAVRAASALVASEGGVVLATGTEDGFELSSPLELCGKPLRIAPLGDELWAVATTLGLTLVAGDVDSPLRVVSTALLVPHGRKGSAERSLNVMLAGSGECENARTAGFIEITSHGTALAAVSGARLLYASGPLIVDIDTHEPTAPALRSSTRLPQPLRALRVDPLGERAYGVSSSEKHQPLFDLRGTTLQPAGTHEVGAWVERREASDLRVRVSSQHAELAKVAQ